MHQLLYATEHYQGGTFVIAEEFKLFLIKDNYNKPFRGNDEKSCFKVIHQQGILSVFSSYYIGVDWIAAGKVALYVEPKLNVKGQVNFMSMLLNSLEAPENIGHLDGLFEVDFEQPWIAIPQQKDLLSPLLIVQFLKLLTVIARKGLKKSYYTVTENFNGKVRGKILIGDQLKKNIFRNRKERTICEYQEFGANIRENQFLKTVLSFVRNYLHTSDQIFSAVQKRQLREMIDYCAPAFTFVDELSDKRAEVKIQNKVFFKDYQSAIRIGKFILKRFSYNINKRSETLVTTPPFWIDMSKMFELYVFSKLKKLLPGPMDVSYHDRFLGGKETDILIRAENYTGVVDCKYKPRYLDNDPSLADKRQLAGYVRLKSVYNKLGRDPKELINGLIIFSSQDCKQDFNLEDLYSIPIEEYVGFYKLGVSLPEI